MPRVSAGSAPRVGPTFGPRKRSAPRNAILSTFRLRLNQVWHVALPGQAPPENLDRSLRRFLATGEPASLPDDLLQELFHNWQHRHSSLGMLTPGEFETQQLSTATGTVA
jgi:transposase InsO family protein